MSVCLLCGMTPVMVCVVVTWCESGDCRPRDERSLCGLTPRRGLSVYLISTLVLLVLLQCRQFVY